MTDIIVEKKRKRPLKYLVASIALGAIGIGCLTSGVVNSIYTINPSSTSAEKPRKLTIGKEYNFWKKGQVYLWFRAAPKTSYALNINWGDLVTDTSLEVTVTNHVYSITNKTTGTLDFIFNLYRDQKTDSSIKVVKLIQ